MALPQVFVFGVDLVRFGIDFANFYALYFAISLTLNLETGYTGVPNFGKVLYVAGGASVAGSLSGRLAASVYGISTRGDFITFNNAGRSIERTSLARCAGNETRAAGTQTGTADTLRNRSPSNRDQRPDLLWLHLQRS